MEVAAAVTWSSLPSLPASFRLVELPEGIILITDDCTTVFVGTHSALAVVRQDPLDESSVTTPGTSAYETF